MANTSLFSFKDNNSDLEPSSENAFPRELSSQAPKSLIAFPKSNSDWPSSEKTRMSRQGLSNYLTNN